MSLGKEVVQGEIEVIEKGLEELSVKIISVLKDYREKGLIGEEEYKKNVRLKEELLTYLNKKKQATTIE